MAARQRSALRASLWAGLLAFALLLLPAVPARAQSLNSLAVLDSHAWAKFSDLLRPADPAFADPVVRRESSAAIDPAEMHRTFDWSGEAGVLIHVRLQVPVTGAGAAEPIDVPILLGVGADPLDAAVAAYFVPPLQPPARPGMRYAPERSFYVWATVRRTWLGERLRFQQLPPPASAELRRQVDLILADPRAAPVRRAARTLRVMEGVRVRAGLGTPAIQAAKLNEVLIAYRAALQALSAGQLNRYDWSEWERGTDRALQLVTAYRNILTIKGLRVQADATIRPGLKDDVRRAATVPALITVLTEDRDALRLRRDAIDIPALERAEADRYADFVLEVQASGEDAETLRRLLPPR
jgi:hypothetical protein